MNLLESCNLHYEEYAKNTILSFFKDITDFANSMDSDVDLSINFYYKKPILTWFKNNQEFEQTQQFKNYDVEDFDIIFDYISNFTEVDSYKRILNMHVTTHFLDNLKNYADDNLANNNQGIDYKKLSEDNYSFFKLFLVSHFIEEFTHLAKELDIDPIEVEFYDYDGEHNYEFEYPRNKEHDYIYSEEHRNKLEDFINSYNEDSLDIIYHHILVGQEYVNNSGDYMVKDLVITKDFNTNLDNLLESQLLIQLKSLIEKEQLEATIVSSPNKNMKLKV